MDVFDRRAFSKLSNSSNEISIFNRCTEGCERETHLPKHVINCNSMRSILRHGDIEWAAECYITSPKTKIRVFKHPKEIETLLHKYEKVFRDLPHGRPPNRGVEYNIVLEEGSSPF